VDLDGDGQPGRGDYVSFQAVAIPQEGTVASDLGDHRLKGLERTERIWQVLPASLVARPPVP